MLHCPACDKEFANWPALRDHLKKALADGDDLHIEVIDGEEWDLSAPSIDKADLDEV